MRHRVHRSLVQWRALLCICLCSFVGCGIATAEQGACAGREPEIWLGMRGLARDWQAVNGYQGWERLFFQADQMWPESMAEVRVIAIGSPVISKLSDGDLAKVVTRLKQKQVALAVNILAQAYLETVPTCGQNVEGYSARGDHRTVAARVKKAGGTIRYVAMDERLYFGHYYNGAHACHSTIENIAERVATNIREYQNVFPDVAVADTVPIPSLTEQPNWQQDYRKWAQAFRMASVSPSRLRLLTSIGIMRAGGRAPSLP